MKINISRLSVLLLTLSFLFCPRDIPFKGLHSYRIVILLVILLNIRKVRINTRLFNFSCVLYIIYVAVAYLIGDGIMSFAGFIIDTGGLIMAVYVSIDSEVKIRLFAKYMCGASIVYSLMCILEAITGFNIFLVIAGASASKMRFGFYRSIGVANHSINNGLILAMLVLLLLYFQVKAYCNSKRITLAIVLSTIACFLTLSRTPLIALALVFLFYFIERGGLYFLVRHKNKTILCIFALIIVFSFSSTARRSFINVTNMFLAVFNDNVAEEITSSFGSNASGIGERFDLYRWIYDDMGNHHVFGVGANTAFEHDFHVTAKTIRTKTSIENQYLKMFYYFGFVGLCIFIVFLLKVMLVSLINSKKDKIYRYTKYALFVLSVCWFLVSSVDDFRWLLLFVSLMYIVPTIDNKGDNI